MSMKFKVFLLTCCFLFIATTVFALPFWQFHTGHTAKYTRIKSDGTNWVVTMTIGAGGQSQCSRNDYYQVTETDYDGPGTGDETMYLRVTETAGYQCESGTEIMFFQTGPEGTSWQYPADLTTDGVKFQVVSVSRFGAMYVIRRVEIGGGVSQPAVFNTFVKGFGLMKETDNNVADNAPWTQVRHGFRGKTLYANFTGSGLYVYDYEGTGSWRRISANVADKMVHSGSNLYAAFAGSGLYLYDGSTWTRINSTVPADMVTIGWTLYASFTGSGLYKFTQDGTWARINTGVPASMVESGSNLYVSFTGSGLYKYDGSTWARINTVVPAKMASGQD